MAIIWGKIDKLLLEPNFCVDVEKFLGDSKFDWYVTEGYRSPERSAKLYDEYINGVWIIGPDGQWVRGKKGPRAAPAGKSAHNFGLAIDVVLDGDAAKPGLQVSWNTKAAGWTWLKTASIIHPRLKNGWSFSDWPHLERFKWENYKGWQVK